MIRRVLPRNLLILIFALIAFLSACSSRNNDNVANTSNPSSNVVANYKGHHETANCDRISGWAWDTAQPNKSLNVDIYEGGLRVATVPASGFRQDLVDAGQGNGKHGFEFAFPDKLKDGKPHSIEVKVAGTDFKLDNSPKSITCPIK